jgi:hypothetical protein
MIFFPFLLLKSDQRGKREEKFTAFSFSLSTPMLSAVGENDFPRDAQAQAGSFVAAFRNAKEFVENAAAKFLGHAGALILDGKANVFGAFPLCRKRDGAAGRRVFHRIGNEIGEDLVDAGAADFTRGRCGSFPLSVPARGKQRVPFRARHLLDQLLAGNGLLLDQSRAAFKTGQIEQVLDHFKQAVRVAPGGQEQFGLLGIERPDFFLQQEIDRHCMLVSGVLSSWLTVAIKSVFTSSATRKRVTSCKATTTPTGFPVSLRMARTRGRKIFAPSRLTRIALSKLVG